jgi:regulatory protein
MTAPTDTHRRRKPRPATRERLRKAALSHIDRYATSAANLRAVLMRRVTRSARLYGTDPAEGESWADEIVAELVERGLVDDRTYAETRAASLHRSGASRRKILASLSVKGVGEDDIARALEALDRQHPDAEFVAACRHAQRRRLGPWRTRAPDEKTRGRELASMARAGFGYRLACRIVDAGDPEELDSDG